MANAFTVFVDPGYTFQERLEIGNSIIRFIIKRSKGGKGVGGYNFGEYSTNYKKTLEYRMAKRGQRKVNLSLTGEMLNTLEVLDASVAGRIEIGYEDGEESDKSEYMRDKGYNFMGVSDQELDSILRRFRDPSATLPGLLRRLIGS